MLLVMNGQVPLALPVHVCEVAFPQSLASGGGQLTHGVPPSAHSGLEWVVADSMPRCPCAWSYQHALNTWARKDSSLALRAAHHGRHLDRHFRIAAWNLSWRP